MYSFQSREEVERFLSSEFVNTTEATELLNCSRQYLHKLVKEGKLTPARTLDKDRLYWKADIIARMKPSE